MGKELTIAPHPTQATYKALVQQMWLDGRIIPEEVTTLTTMQAQLGISPEDAENIEREVMGQTKEEALVTGLGTNVPASSPAGSQATPTSGSSLVVGTFSGGKTLVDTSADEARIRQTMSARPTGAGFAARSAEPGILHEGDLVADRFKVLKVLGEGGMAQVLKVKDSKLGDERALKVIRTELLDRPDVIERFHNEVLTCQKLSHPNIIRVFDYDLDEARGLHFFTMEFVKGWTLHKWLKQKLLRKKQVSYKEFLVIAHGVCRALTYAHKHTVHRDLKPENIMIEQATRGIKLMDFGIATLFSGQREYVTSGPIGTVHYMAPEQEACGQVDQRADIYSAGVVFYQVLAGEIPRAGSKPISELRADIPTSISTAIVRAMSTSPEDRFTTAKALFDALSEKEQKEDSGAEAEDLLEALSKQEEKKDAIPEDPIADKPIPATARPAPPRCDTAGSIPMHPLGLDVSALQLPPAPASGDDLNESKALCTKVADRFFGDTKQHRDRMFQLCEYHSAQVNPADIPAIIGAINDWSNHKGAYIRNLGNEITITKATRSDAIIADLNVILLHRRLVHRPIKPSKTSGHSAEGLHAVIEGFFQGIASPDLSGVSKPQKFQDSKIPDAITQSDCAECATHGILECGKCNGQGQYTQDQTTLSEAVRDGFMDGDHSVRGELHRIDRHHRQNTVVVCDVCDGTGRTRCAHCAGTGHIPLQLLLRTRIWPEHLRVISTSSPIRHDQLEGSTANRVLYDGSIHAATRNATDSQRPAPPPIAEWMRELVTNKNALGQAGPYVVQPAFVQLVVRSHIVDTIEFLYEGCEHFLHVTGADRTVLEGNVPTRGKVAMRRFGRGVMNLLYPNREQESEQRVAPANVRTEGGAAVFPNDYDLRIARWLERNDMAFTVGRYGYEVAPKTADGHGRRLTITLNGTTVRFTRLVTPVKPERYRDVLCENLKVRHGGFGITRTNKGDYFSVVRSLLFASAGDREIAGAVSGTNDLVRRLQRMLA